MIILKRLQNISSTKLRGIFHIMKLFNGHSPFSPRFIQLLLTYKCNANCPFCYQAEEKKNITDMSICDAKIIEQNIRKSFNFKPRIHFFGGEPTVNNDFIKILKYFSDSGYKVSITTNGIDILKYIREISSAKGLKDMHFSINDLDFERVLSSLKQIQDTDASNNFSITLNCPITEINQDRLFDIVEIFENSGVQCLTFQHRAFIWYKGFAPMDYELIRNQYNRIKKRRNNIPIIFHPNIKSRNIKAYYTEKDYPYNKNKCYYPWFVLFIQPNGNIIPCDEIDVTIGNAKKESLKILWNNTDYVNFRKSILVNGISHSICNRCDHREY